MNSSPDSQSRSLADSLTARDRELLSALDRGDPIDLIEYADWIRRPEIQHLLTVRDQLHADQERARERRNRDFADTETRAAVAILNDTILEADKLRKADGATTTDQLKALNTRRIAASSILRLCNHHRARAATLRHSTAPPPPLGGSVPAGSAAGTRRAPSSTRSTPPPRPATSDQTQDPQDSSTQHSASPEASRRGDPSTEHSSPPVPCTPDQDIRDTIIRFLTLAANPDTRFDAIDMMIDDGKDVFGEPRRHIWLKYDVAWMTAEAVAFGRAWWFPGDERILQQVTLTYDGGRTEESWVLLALHRNERGEPSKWLLDGHGQPDTFYIQPYFKDLPPDPPQPPSHDPRHGAPATDPPCDPPSPADAAPAANPPDTS